MRTMQLFRDLSITIKLYWCFFKKLTWNSLKFFMTAFKASTGGKMVILERQIKCH